MGVDETFNVTALLLMSFNDKWLDSLLHFLFLNVT